MRVRVSRAADLPADSHTSRLDRKWILEKARLGHKDAKYEKRNMLRNVAVSAHILLVRISLSKNESNSDTSGL